MIKKLSKYGNSLAVLIDKPILELLSIDENTKIKIKTDGENIILIPIRKSKPKGENDIEEAYSEIVKKYSDVFRKLAKH